MSPNLYFKMWPKDLDSSAIIMVSVYTVRKIIYFSLSV